MAARVLLREITNDEGNRLLRIVRRTSGSVVTWRRAQIVLLSAQGMTPPRISEVVFTDPDTVRDVIHNFNRDGFDALYPRYGFSSHVGYITPEHTRAVLTHGPCPQHRRSFQARAYLETVAA